MFTKHSSKLLALIIAGIGLCSIAHAQSGYKTVGILKTDLQSMDWNGGKVTVGSLKGVLEVSGSTGIVPNGPHMQNCLMRVIKMNEGTDISTQCNLTDKDGDVLITVSERKQGDISAGGKGKTKYIGGTGKYKGVSGGCEYSAKYLPDNWLRVESECKLD